MQSVLYALKSVPRLRHQFRPRTMAALQPDHVTDLQASKKQLRESIRGSLKKMEAQQMDEESEGI